MAHTVKKIGIAAIIALFVAAIMLSVFSLPKGLNASPGVFRVSVYGSGVDTGNHDWRGYAFTVSTQASKVK